MRSGVVLFASVGVLAMSPLVMADVMLHAAMTADNAFTASVSTGATSAGAVFLVGSDWQSTFSGSYTFPAAGTYYLHVQAVDFGRPEMFIGQFSLTQDAGSTFSNGTTALLTNSTDWVVSNTGFGVDTLPALDVGQNGASPWSTRPGIDGAARFVWAPTYTPTVYFSTVITVVPGPAAIASLGLGLMVAGWRRR